MFKVPRPLSGLGAVLVAAVLALTACSDPTQYTQSASSGDKQAAQITQQPTPMTL